mmetsp:Transcript_622/g.2569  ORF Transcript_622/g.2569 Transcript_622/m.2569 type:complete len:386 (-) Transcript_622:142-1299(-)
MTDDETPLIGDDGSRNARRTRVGSLLLLIAAVAIVVASATAKRDDGADLGACPQGRADVALLVSGSVRSFMIPNVYKSLKTNLIDFMASHCINVHPIMYLGLKEAAGIEHGGLPYPQAIPSDLDEALDHVNVAAVDFYEPTQYDSKQFPWGHCSKPVEYDRPTSVWAHFDKAQKLLCMARKVEMEENIHFSWYMHSRPEYFWYAPPPVDFARTLWDGQDTNHDTDAVQPTLIFDENWYWKYNDAFYVVHSSRADAFWGKGTGALRSIACVSPRSQMNPESSIFHVADYAHCNVRRGISLGHSAWPDRDGMGVHWCHGISEGNTTMIKACNKANKISIKANAKYRERAKDWLEKRAAAAAAEAEAAGSAAAKPAPPERPAARGPTC